MKVFANANRLKILIYLSYFHIYKSIAKRYHHYAFCISALCIAQNKFEVKNGQFLKNGEPVYIIGGELHYARIPKEYWRHRIQMAKAMGINVTFYKLFVFVVAAFFAGCAGVLYAHTTTPVLYSFFSYNYSIEILVMVVLGGMGNLTGSLIAAAAVTLINSFLQAKLPGDLAVLKDLLYAAICGSYNDAFYILAVHTDGSLQGFVERMNTRAKEIGMKNTRFEDPTGLIGGSRTTAADIALLAKVAYQNELYMQLCNTVSYSFSTLKKQDVECDNRNALICQYDETKYFQKHCNGMSAGSTSADGNCVITVAKHENETYICVVLGAQETDAEQFGYRIVNRLVDWVYQTYSYVEIISPDVEICRIPVTVSDRTTEVTVKTELEREVKVFGNNTVRPELVLGYDLSDCGVKVGEKVRFSVLQDIIAAAVEALKNAQ